VGRPVHDQGPAKLSSDIERSAANVRMWLYNRHARRKAAYAHASKSPAHRVVKYLNTAFDNRLNVSQPQVSKTNGAT
jgi:hypothetical protein